MRIPVATYRVQFNQDFRFNDAIALVPALHRLGISHLYASPLFAAREGSTHGYDVIDPNRLNPALGSAEEFDRLVRELQSRGMGLLLDIVPNHMAASPQNQWWMDVLENGSSSAYAGYFGIDWTAGPHSQGEKIFLPILGAPYGSVLESQDLKLSYEEAGFFISYYSLKLPVGPATYAAILSRGAEQLIDRCPDFRHLLEMLARLPLRSVAEWEALEDRTRVKEEVKRKLRQLYSDETSVRQLVDSNVTLLNGIQGDPRSFDGLHVLLEEQAYRLAFWKVATERINYRRFFDVSDLVGMRAEDPQVFQASHALTLQLVAEGKVEGLRVDHVDGLLDPEGYLKRLSECGAYITVEKILSGRETLDPGWPVQGTTGYDFLGFVNGIFVDPRGLDRLTAIYTRHTGLTATLEEVEYDRRKHVIQELFAGEIQDLGAHVSRLAEGDRHARDLSVRDLTQALTEITASMPVYRTYTNSETVSQQDLLNIGIAINAAHQRAPLDRLVWDFCNRVLTLHYGPAADASTRQAWLAFVMRWQQITGPIMAKGVEDSAYYVYNRLLSLNDVGGIPQPVAPSDFHVFLRERAPATMNATSTHDTKRSEDVRARLNVLSELPDEWARHLSRWRRIAEPARGAVSPNDEYLLYQNLLGAWPLSAEELPNFRDRFKAYLVKAVREARTHSSWLQPDTGYETALTGFTDALLENERFLATFLPFQQRVAFYGAMNSLAQTLLKVTAPGVPDFYQGAIGWNLSLVDPDNRGPAPPPDLPDPAERPRVLLDTWADGRIKSYVTGKALEFRKSHPSLFREGNYQALDLLGKRAGNALAFARQREHQWAIVIVPRLITQLSVVVRPPTGIPAWRDTALALPENAPRVWRNVLTGEKLNLASNTLPLHQALQRMPVALLTALH